MTYPLHSIHAYYNEVLDDLFEKHYIAGHRSIYGMNIGPVIVEGTIGPYLLAKAPYRHYILTGLLSDKETAMRIGVRYRDLSASVPHNFFPGAIASLGHMIGDSDVSPATYRIEFMHHHFKLRSEFKGDFTYEFLRKHRTVRKRLFVRALEDAVDMDLPVEYHHTNGSEQNITNFCSAARSLDLQVIEFPFTPHRYFTNIQKHI